MSYYYYTDSDSDDDYYRSYSSNNSVKVFTKGACSNNGNIGARAAIGVFFGNKNPNNVSRRIEGRQTNQLAEIEAARVAIELAADNGYDSVTVMTDSQFLIDSVTKWIHKWINNGWKKFNRREVKNREAFEDLLDAMDRVEVTWEKVCAHTGVYGNVQAYRMARAALHEVIAYTYSCSGRGQVGVSIYFPNSEIEKLYARLGGEGPITVQRGDIVAARLAIERAKEAGFKRIALKTNSQYLIDAITKWIPNWQKKRWIGSSGRCVKNRNDFSKLLTVMANIDVQFIKDTHPQAMHLARSVL